MYILVPVLKTWFVVTLSPPTLLGGLNDTEINGRISALAVKYRITNVQQLNFKAKNFKLSDIGSVCFVVKYFPL